MHVVRHEAVRLDRQPVFFGVFAQQIEIPHAVTLGEEHILTTVPTLRHVMRTTRNDDTSHTRHAPTLSTQHTPVNPKNMGSVPMFSVRNV